jgi:hypothetical protein
LLCSDDVNFWKETNLFHDKRHFLLEGEDEVTTLALLSQFSYFILANSTFSWWGAWLADTKHVIAPMKWFGPTGPPSYQDIYMPEWEKV